MKYAQSGGQSEQDAARKCDLYPQDAGQSISRSLIRFLAAASPVFSDRHLNSPPFHGQQRYRAANIKAGRPSIPVQMMPIEIPRPLNIWCLPL